MSPWTPTFFVEIVMSENNTLKLNYSAKLVEDFDEIDDFSSRVKAIEANKNVLNTKNGKGTEIPKTKDEEIGNDVNVVHKRMVKIGKNFFHHI